MVLAFALTHVFCAKELLRFGLIETWPGSGKFNWLAFKRARSLALKSRHELEQYGHLFLEHLRQASIAFKPIVAGVPLSATLLSKHPSKARPFLADLLSDNIMTYVRPELPF